MAPAPHHPRARQPTFNVPDVVDGSESSEQEISLGLHRPQARQPTVTVPDVVDESESSEEEISLALPPRRPQPSWPFVPLVPPPGLQALLADLPIETARRNSERMFKQLADAGADFASGTTSIASFPIAYLFDDPNGLLCW